MEKEKTTLFPKHICSALLRKWATRLNSGSGGLQKKGKWILMCCICLPLLTLSTVVLFEAFKLRKGARMNPPEEIVFSRPAPVTDYKNRVTKEQIVAPVLYRFRVIRDSMQREGQGKWEAFLLSRPGLMDSIKILEAMIYPQNDTAKH